MTSQQSQTAGRVLDSKHIDVQEDIWKTDATTTGRLDDMHKRHDVQRQHVIDSVRGPDSFSSHVLTPINL